MGMLEAIRIFQSITKKTIHGGMSEKNDSGQDEPRKNEIPSCYHNDYSNTFVMKDIV